MTGNLVIEVKKMDGATYRGSLKDNQFQDDKDLKLFFFFDSFQKENNSKCTPRVMT